MTSDLPALDLSRIPFPSDRISFGLLRKLHPAMFDSPPPSGAAFFDDPDNAEQDRLAGLMYREREYACMVFDEAATGVKWEERERGNELIQAEKQLNSKRLIKDYQAIGIAKGFHEAREMVRSIETAVQSQLRPR